MTKNRVAIIQPSFLPWRGYFKIIKSCNSFVFYDDVQFDKRGWRNRNRIKTASGAQWISVPVITKGKYHQKINETEISYEDERWAKKMLQTISYSYSKSPFFNQYYPWLEKKLTLKNKSIAELTIDLTKDVCGFLEINVDFVNSSALNVDQTLEKSEKLIAICKALSATHYLSGPSAANYIGDGEVFKSNKIFLEYADYTMPPYTQLYGEFIPDLSIIDLLFNAGSESRNFL